MSINKFKFKLKGVEIEYFLELYEDTSITIKDDVFLEKRKMPKTQSGLLLSGIEILAVVSATNATISLAKLLKSWLTKKKKKQIIIVHEGTEIELLVDASMSTEEIKNLISKVIDEQG